MTTNEQTAPVGQAEYWNGPTGEKWAALQARIDDVFAPLTTELMARAAARPGERCLDIGCGAGDLALRLAERVGPGGHVTGIDLSRPLLARAAWRAAARTAEAIEVEWVEADAQTADLPPVDLLASRFGVMFFPDPLAALLNLRGALRPCGRLCVMAWRHMAENGWASVPAAAVASIVGEVAPYRPGVPGPFAFADHERVIAMLREAGFADVRATPVDADLPIGRASEQGAALESAVAYSLQIGPAARALKDVGDEALRARAKAAVAAALRPHEQNGEIRLPAACWIYEARAR